MIRYRPEVDGLRAVAVIPVVLFHAGLPAIEGGFVGVDVFFVISGYLITALMLAERRAGTFSLADFYERRARRILPLLFTVMLACVPLAWLLLLPLDLKDFADSLLAASGFGSNLYFWRTLSYFATDTELKPLLHTWSLAVEEQFYLLYPAFLALAWRLPPRRLLMLTLALLAAGLAFAHWSVIAHPRFAFYWLPARAWELLAGAALAMAGDGWTRALPGTLRGALAAAGLALIGWAVFAYDEWVVFPGLAAVPPVAGAALVIAFATPDTRAGRLLASRPLVSIGLVSYGLYLWHQPLFAFARHGWLDEPTHAQMVALALAAGGLSWLTWRWIERPMRDRRRIDRRRLVRTCAAAAAVLLAWGIAADRTAGFRDFAPDAVRTIEAAVVESRSLHDERHCHVEESGDAGLTGCVLGAPGATPTAALVGDSHAMAIAHALGRLGAAEGGSFVQYTKSACGFAQGLVGNQGLACIAFLDAALADIARRGLTTAVIATRWPWYAEDAPYDNGEGGREKRERVFGIAGRADLQAPPDARHAAVRAAYTAMLRRAREVGLRLVIVHGVPEMGWNVPARVAKGLRIGPLQPDWASTDAAATRRRQQPFDALLDAFGESAAIAHVRPVDVLCDAEVPGRCAAHRDGRPLYQDDDHLSESGADRVIASMRGKVWPAAHRLPHVAGG